MSAIQDLKDFAGEFTPGGPYLETPELTEKIEAVDRAAFWRGFLSGGLVIAAGFIIVIIVIVVL